MISLEGILNIIFRSKKVDDSSLVERGKSYDNLAKGQSCWVDAKKYLKKAKKNYSRLQEDKEKYTLEHGRTAVSISLEETNNYELIEQLNYGKKIFKKYNSTDDLYNLACKAEKYASKLDVDTSQLKFLEYARNIFIKLGKNEDVERVIGSALEQSSKFLNIVSYSRFIKFAAESYKKVDQKEKAKESYAKIDDLNKNNVLHPLSCLMTES